MIRRVVVLLALLAGLLSSLPAAAETPKFALPAFQQTWARTDMLVAVGQVTRTWMWGPLPNTEAMQEAYEGAPGGQRTVQYFDKSRMEDNSWRETQAPWNVTNGLLVKELITGSVQVGDNQFLTWIPAPLNVAGDPDDPDGATYADFAPLLSAPAAPQDSIITQVLQRDGTVHNDQSFTGYGVTAASVVNVPGLNHTVASVFWDFMNSSGAVFQDGSQANDKLFLNPFYATGYPLTEAYWTTVKVGGAPKQVLAQCFERRCLTYTPSNPDGWKVEAGNVGQHYYFWRYALPTILQADPCHPVVPYPFEPTYEWLNPDVAVREALQQTHTSLGNPFAQFLLSNAVPMRNAYGLVTADTGCFNQDTSGYYSWVVDQITGAGPSDQDLTSYKLHAQVRAATTQPDSAIAYVMRQIAAGNDPDRPVHGPSGEYAYWEYLIAPASFNDGDLTNQIKYNQFQQVVASYHLHLQDSSFNQDFGSFLASSGYISQWFSQ